MNYLTYRYNNGDKYNTLNTHRSAISAFHVPIDNVKVGQHLAVTGIMSAFFNARPPLPRYQVTWDVDQVLQYIESLGENKSLALKQLTYKLNMLLALACAGRSSDLRALDTSFMRMENDSVTFSLARLTKSRRKGKPPLTIVVHKFGENPLLCAYSTLVDYLDRTKRLRQREDPSKRTQVLLSFVEPHRAVVPCTIAGWLVKLMTDAGVDTSEFKAHSTRGASTSKAAAQGLSCSEILKMAKWSKEATFYKHYHRKIVKQSKKVEFASTVLAV